MNHLECYWMLEGSEVGALDFSPIYPDDSNQPQSALLLVASIANLQEIEFSFGLAARQEAFERLRAEMRRIASRACVTELESAGLVEAVIEAGAGAGRSGYLIHRLACKIMSRPIISASGSFYAVPEIGTTALDHLHGDIDGAKARAYQQIERTSVKIQRPWHLFRYRDDMKRAVGLFERVDRGEAMLVWQAIVSPAHERPILYFEGLLRVPGEDGALISCEADIRAVERVGLAPELDRRLVSHVLDQLEADPDVRMGVNISARSASLHRYGRNSAWRELRSRLERDPDLARRLVIEITETAEFASLDEAGEFVSLMQHLGCQVAIDDFGAGRGSIIQYAALSADIIKIDGSFIQGARQDERGYATFRHLVGLGRALVPAVVVEGIETADQAELARGIGVDWFQGYHFGRPSPTRALGISADARAIMALRNFQDRVRALSRADGTLS